MQKFTEEHHCRSAISIKLQIRFIEITLRHGCSSVNLLHDFRTPFPKTYGGLLLKISIMKQSSRNEQFSFDSYFFIILLLFVKFYDQILNGGNSNVSSTEILKDNQFTSAVTSYLKISKRANSNEAPELETLDKTKSNFFSLKHFFLFLLSFTFIRN